MDENIDVTTKYPNDIVQPAMPWKDGFPVVDQENMSIAKICQVLGYVNIKARKRILDFVMDKMVINHPQQEN